jgi:predicted component of type VI protein secretion system
VALTVVVRSVEGDAAPSITLDAPRVVIGRGDGCEVRLPDPSVSHRHASIRQRGAEYIVLDEGSTNGTFVGPVRLAPQAPRVLRSGDLVRVGRVWLEICIEQVPPTQNSALATCEMALALVASALSAEGSPSAPRVSVAEGPGAGAELVLDRPLT